MPKIDGLRSSRDEVRIERAAFDGEMLRERGDGVGEAAARQYQQDRNVRWQILSSIRSGRGAPGLFIRSRLLSRLKIAPNTDGKLSVETSTVSVDT